MQLQRPNPPLQQKPVAVKPVETKEEAGIRLARKRLPALKKRLESVAKLGAYPLGEMRFDQICREIDVWVSETKVLLQKNGKKTTYTFEFK